MRPADLYIKGGTVINVYSGEFLRMNVAIYKNRIAYVGEGEQSIGENTRILNAEGKYVSPGYIEPHAHPWVIYNPISLMSKVVPLGTTTVVHDNLFFYLRMGPEGFGRMLDDLTDLIGNNLWLVRLVSQAEYPGERDWYNETDIRRLLDRKDVVGTAEVTRWPLLYKGDPMILDTIDYAKSLGKISDGHTAGCSYEKLNSIVDAGISACHEAITANEALDRLRLGMWTTLRNSSLRPDFPEIIKMITKQKVSTHRVLMTTDGPHPAFIEDEGCVDVLLRKAVEMGVSPMQAIQMATINAAVYLGMDEQIGGISPSRLADVLILPDLVSFRPETVIAGGEVVAEGGKLSAALPQLDWHRYMEKNPFGIKKERLQDLNLYRYPHYTADGPVPVASFRSTVITRKKEMDLPIRSGCVDLSKDSGLMYASLIERGGQWVSHAILENFATTLEGMASTYNTTTQLLTIGNHPEAMSKAAMRVLELGGGIVLVEGGEVVLEIPLPLTGMMTTSSDFGKAVEYQNALLSAVQDRGYPFHDILYTLLFLTCDFLPGLRLVPLGLYDVRADEVLKPARTM
ncbi:adenine deaminase C-terminal domain-containing protein [Ferviditalea candida]